MKKWFLAIALVSALAGTAEAQKKPYTLQVSVTGSGTVTGGGISCPGTCSVNFASGANVILSATPSTGNVFSGWGGACAGTSPSCTLTIASNVSVTAAFTSSGGGGGGPPALTRVFFDTSAGTVTLVGANLNTDTSATLGAYTLSRQTSSGDAWTAAIPSGMPNGDYLLTATNPSGSARWQLTYPAVGPQGPPGPQGLQGQQGLQGPKGADGAAGPMGPVGPNGSAGPAGPVGQTGPQGATGAIGPQGPEGPAGPQGPAGDSGVQLKFYDYNGREMFPYVGRAPTYDTFVFDNVTENKLMLGLFRSGSGATIPVPIALPGRQTANGDSGGWVISPDRRSVWIYFASSNCSGEPHFLSRATSIFPEFDNRGLFIFAEPFLGKWSIVENDSASGAVPIASKRQLNVDPRWCEAASGTAFKVRTVSALPEWMPPFTVR